MAHHKAIHALHKKRKIKFKIDPQALIDAKVFHATSGVRFDDFDDEEVRTMNMEEPESHYASEHALDDKTMWSLERSKATKEIIDLERQALIEGGHKLAHAHGHSHHILDPEAHYKALLALKLKQAKDEDAEIARLLAEAKAKAANRNLRSAASSTVYSAVALFIALLVAVAF